MTKLRDYLNDKYGSIRQMSIKLGLDEKTIRVWTDQKPRNLLKYAPEICNQLQVPPKELMDRVVDCEIELRSK